MFNEWYIRDCSRKVTAVLRAKGMSGKHTTNHAIYGYHKDPDDPGHWLIDEEAAAVVRRIFQLTIAGNGPHQIARILTEEKVERPANYLGRRSQGTCQNRDYSDERYIWQGTTISEMLTKPEYMGHTVNFRTYKESYKDKRPKKAAKEDWVIFENTQEAIVAVRDRQGIGRADPTASAGRIVTNTIVLPITTARPDLVRPAPNTTFGLPLCVNWFWRQFAPPVPTLSGMRTSLSKRYAVRRRSGRRRL